MGHTPLSQPVKPEIFVGAFLTTASAASVLDVTLSGGSYVLQRFDSAEPFLQFVKQQRQAIDCLVIEETNDLSRMLGQLRSHLVLLPAVVLVHADQCLPRAAAEESWLSDFETTSYYHAAIIRLPIDQIDYIETALNRVIDQFLKLSPDSTHHETATLEEADDDTVLIGQQQRLAQKLRERLGYLGVYYKRDPTTFLRYMDSDQRKRFLAQLRQDYRDIVLSYFSDDNQANQKIDHYVNAAFFADVPIAQVVEIHMELMDEFAKQLKLEGRSEEILLDYRLTLIDTLANLCEMYRRSIPRNS